MSKCALCWKSGNWTTKASIDNKYIFYKDSVLCPKCFNAWATGNEDELMKILEEKLFHAPITKQERTQGELTLPLESNIEKKSEVSNDSH